MLLLPTNAWEKASLTITVTGPSRGSSTGILDFVKAAHSIVWSVTTPNS